MAEPFLAEIKIVGFNFAPRGFAQCDGQILPINQNQSLYSLLGTTYGGDGRTSFALPDLRGRTPVHEGSGITLGEKGGEERHPLTQSEIPNHTHVLNATKNGGGTFNPSGNQLANAGSQVYHDPTNLTALSSLAVAQVGASQGHENMQPFLALNYVIALQGVFPSRN